MRAWLEERVRVYRRTLQPDRRTLIESYRLVDFARKVVGVGSVGTRCWIALFLGRDDGDPLFLQIKEAEASVLEAHAGRSGFANHGQRVVEGQRLLQASSDILLGWIHTRGLDDVDRDFYVRQLWDWKVSAEIEQMTPQTLGIYAQLCGWTWPAATPVPVTASRLRPTSARTTRSTVPSPTSAPPTRTRTSVTTRRSSNHSKRRAVEA